MKNNNELYKLRCFKCKKEFDENVTYTNCLACGAPLEVVMNYDKIGERLNVPLLKSAPITATKYLDFYPLRNLRKVVTLNEGGTPLYKANNLAKRLKMKKLYIKFEGANPTGAFKDRGSMVELTKALEMKKGAVCCASTGNMAASVSAYSAKAGLGCFVLVPEGTAIGKLSQTLAYGARIIQVRGTYNEAAILTEEIAEKHKFYLAGDYAFRLEGQKSQAFEIAEQLGWRSPDKVIVPIGCGTNSSAIWKGFKEFLHFDLVDSLPQIIAAQADGACPVVKAFKNKSNIEVIDKPQTIAGAINVGNPLDGLKILSSLQESKGNAGAVTDHEILEAEKLLARTESIFVEPAAATTVALLKNMLDSGAISRDEEVVLVATGVGLKDPLAALKVMPSPPTTEPEYKAVEKLLNYGYYDIVSMATEDVVVFTKAPTIDMLKKTIKELFNSELNNDDLELCLKNVIQFMKRGKHTTKPDLQLIIKRILQRMDEKDKILKVIDFKIESHKNSFATSSVSLKYNGEEMELKRKGVGPVDSIINAIKEALKDKSIFKFRLVDYNVEIYGKGTNATVDVKMTLCDDKKNKVIGFGTSPDIIVASVQAFENGYNILHMKNKKESGV